MSDLVGTQIVGFLTHRLIFCDCMVMKIKISALERNEEIELVNTSLKYLVAGFDLV